MIESKNSNGTVEVFNHPFLQATFMFIGESLCMVVFLLTIAFKVPMGRIQIKYLNFVMLLALIAHRININLLLLIFQIYCHKDDFTNKEAPKCLNAQDEESEITEEKKKGCYLSCCMSGGYSIFIFYFPALCDVTATSIMYIALTLTSASSFQMLRGSIMIFVGKHFCLNQ